MTPRELTREEKGDRIGLHLGQQVQRCHPAALFAWNGAWDAVAQADRAIMAAVLEWERVGTPEAQAAVQRAGAEYLAAWDAAAREWKGQGCPRGKVAHA